MKKAAFFFLMKRNNQGKFQWIRFSNGQTLAVKLASDSRGNVFAVCQTATKGVRFTSTDTNTVFVSGQGTVICQYNKDGELLKAKVFENSFFAVNNLNVRDFQIDDKDNLYIGSDFETVTIQNKKRARSFFICKLLLMR